MPRWANTHGILIIHDSQTHINLYRSGASSSKKFNHHSLPSRYVHNIHHFALLLHWKHMADWSTDDHQAGQCCYPVGIARNFVTNIHIYIHSVSNDVCHTSGECS
jgi:hypothetical protein